MKWYLIIYSYCALVGDVMQCYTPIVATINKPLADSFRKHEVPGYTETKLTRLNKPQNGDIVVVPPETLDRLMSENDYQDEKIDWFQTIAERSLDISKTQEEAAPFEVGVRSDGTLVIGAIGHNK